jgi:hypothetical protein
MINWIKATPDHRWADGSTFFVTIRCQQDGSRGVGVFAGDAAKSVAMTRGINVNDGRDYVVTHYCPMQIQWPEPAEEGT